MLVFIMPNPEELPTVTNDITKIEIYIALNKRKTTRVGNLILFALNQIQILIG